MLTSKLIAFSTTSISSLGIVSMNLLAKKIRWGNQLIALIKYALQITFSNVKVMNIFFFGKH